MIKNPLAMSFLHTAKGLIFTIIYIVSEIIRTRSYQAYSKQICLYDLAQIIYIAFIIQVAWII